MSIIFTKITIFYKVTTIFFFIKQAKMKYINKEFYSLAQGVPKEA